jgi:hypothetical protein
MEKVRQPVATAPAHGELELSIYDKDEYHALEFPCQLFATHGNQGRARSRSASAIGTRNASQDQPALVSFQIELSDHPGRPAR